MGWKRMRIATVVGLGLSKSSQGPGEVWPAEEPKGYSLVLIPGQSVWAGEAKLGRSPRECCSGCLGQHCAGCRP